MDQSATKLYEALKELQIIDEKKLTEAFTESESQHTSFVNLLLEKDLISSADLGKTIADSMKIPYASFEKVSLPDSARWILPETFAKHHHVVVFEDSPDFIKVATTNPANTKLFAFIEQKVNKKVVPYFSLEQDIEKTFGIYKQNLKITFDQLLKEQVDILGDGKIREAPIVKIVELLLEYAYSNNASDIHIEPEKEAAKVRFRIDGIMNEVLTLPLEIYKQVILRIKVLASLETDEHLSSQDGKIHITLSEEELDIRVSIVPITHGEKAVLRLLASHFTQFTLSNLGMNEADYKKIVHAINKPFGMILSTGPTGSGKTTSMYAILKILNTAERNIATIEDPVEYEIEGINQIQVNPKTNLTFADGLRSILRQDPNVIYVGEIRDKETAGIAINSALTGHIVLSTLHTNDAATAIPRFIDMGIEPFLVASTINVIIAQRLVRKICDSCKVSQTVSKKDLLKDFEANLIKKVYGASKDFRIYKGKGCPVCHMTGYRGRVGIFEILELHEEIKDLITAKADVDVINKKALALGMTKMIEDGMWKVSQGVTTIEEVLRATKE